MYMTLNILNRRTDSLLLLFHSRDVMAVRIFFISFSVFLASNNFFFPPLDVGGGSVSNKTRHSLARISLRWMIRECFKTNTGIMFDTDSLFKVGLDPSSLYQSVAPRPPPLPIGSNRIRKPPAIPIPINIPALVAKKKKHSDLLAESEKPFMETEEEEELKDAMSPDSDQLKVPSAWPWWILEVLPIVPVIYEDSHGCMRHLKYVSFFFLKKKKKGMSMYNVYWFYRPHLGAPRCIPHHGSESNVLKVHRSVKLRMQAGYEDEKRGKKKYYVPAVHFDSEPIWVD